MNRPTCHFRAQFSHAAVYGHAIQTSAFQEVFLFPFKRMVLFFLPFLMFFFFDFFSHLRGGPLMRRALKSAVGFANLSSLIHFFPLFSEPERTLGSLSVDSLVPP